MEHSNKPLTFEQLLSLGERAENGEKIIVYCTPLNDWCKVFKYGIMFFGTEYYRSWREAEETYGSDWTAYSYPPAKIDLESWKSEWERGCVYSECKNCGYYTKAESHFCPHCGKAMDQHALNIIKNQIGG